MLSDVNTTFITVHLLLISCSFVSRTDQIWKLKPRKSWQIILTGTVILTAQVVHMIVRLVTSGAKYISLFTWILYLLSVPLTVVVNELIKRNEIRVNVRFQKRARLEFGTKLGINSPF